MTDAGHFTISDGASLTNVTLSKEVVCHYITDDQLLRLGEMRKDMVMEICLAATGIFCGSLVPAVDGFRHFGDAAHPATWTDLVSMMLFISALVAAAITGIQWRIRARGHVDLVTEIQNRPRVPVRLVHADPA